MPAPDSSPIELPQPAAHRPFWRRLLPEDPRERTAVGGALALLVPALLCGPWLPWCDLVAFVGLNNFPPPASTGPLQFSVFQFTYIVHYALSRFLHDLGVTPAYQVLIIYLLQAAAFYYVIQALLKRFVVAPWLGAVAIAVGTLAFWDGMFIWGGPLAYSLGAVMVALATAITLREIEEPVPTGGLLVALLLTVAMTCHPFAFVFCLPLALLRWWFVPARRWPTAGLLLFLLVFAFVIRADSSERIATPQLSAMFHLSGMQLGRRLQGLFTLDAVSVNELFGTVPAGLRLYFVLLALVHLAGFVTAPVVAVLARGRPALRMFAVLMSAVAGMYFLSTENNVITQWPQRILTWYSPFTFVAGVIFPWFLVQRFAPALAARPGKERWRWAAPAAVLVMIAWIQVPVLRFGARIGEEYARLRGAFVQADLKNAFIVTTDLERVQPYYLRSAPFLLFSDPEMVRRNNIFFTEWHVQPRHPTRVIEQWFDLGRARMNASFSAADGRMAVKLSAQPPGISPVASGNDPLDRMIPARPAMRQRALGDQLLAVGAARDAVPHYEAALRLGTKRAEVAEPLAVALVQAGRPAEAMRHLRLIIDSEPDQAEAQCDLGILLVQAGDIETGIRHLETAVELRPNVGRWRYELGMAYRRANRLPQAAEQFQAALRADPALQAAREELGRLPR